MSFVHKAINDIIGIINSNKYFFLKDIFVFINIIFHLTVKLLFIRPLDKQTKIYACYKSITKVLKIFQYTDMVYTTQYSATYIS